MSSRSEEAKDKEAASSVSAPHKPEDTPSSAPPADLEGMLPLERAKFVLMKYAKAYRKSIIVSSIFFVAQRSALN